MKDWLQENPDGLKDAFEQYFKALPAEARKVSNRGSFPFPACSYPSLRTDIQRPCHRGCEYLNGLPLTNTMR
jgi:hypothetical protein